MWIIDILEDLKRDYDEGDFYGSNNLTADLLYTIERHPEFVKHKNDTICADDILQMFKRVI